MKVEDREDTRRPQQIPRITRNLSQAGSPSTPATDRSRALSNGRRWRTALTVHRVLLAIIAGAISIAGIGYTLFAILLPVSLGYTVAFRTDVFVPFEIVASIVGIVLAVAWLVDYLIIASQIIVEE